MRKFTFTLLFSIVTKKILIGLLFIGCVSCSTMEHNDRVVRRSDVFNRFSGSGLTAVSGWKLGVSYLKLRKNNTFIFQDKVLGVVKSGYYAGNYTFSNDTLKLVFKNNHKPGVLDSEFLVLKKRDGEEILDTTTGYFLWITKNELALN